MNFKFGITACSLLAVFLLAGCSATGPTRSPEYPQLVVKGLTVASNEKVLDFGPAVLLPNKHSFFAPEFSRFEGVWIITNQTIVFRTWDDKADGFVTLRRTPIQDLAMVRLDKVLRGKLIITQKNDLTFDAYLFHDLDKMDQTADLLKGMLQAK